MGKIVITQVRSGIGRPKKQKLTLRSLGIKKLNKPLEKEASPQVMGMIAKVRHLLEVKEI